MRKAILAWFLLGLIHSAVVLRPSAFAQDARLLVNVFDERSGEPIEGLTASNFEVIDAKKTLRVESAEFKQDLLDILLLVDTSSFGPRMQPLAGAFVDALGEQEQMAIVGFHTSADLMQGFTSDKRALLEAIQRFYYGNNPRALDGLFASLDGGFEGGSSRKVIVLLSSGVEGRSRVAEAEVLQLARERGVSIFVVYWEPTDAALFHRLAEHAGGAYYAARRHKLQPKELAELVYSSIRGHYELIVSGAYTLGNRIKVNIQGLPKSKKKPRAGALVLD